MARILERSEFPEGLYYSGDHLWAKKQNGIVRVEVTDMAQQAAGSILFVRLMPKRKAVGYDADREMGRSSEVSALRNDSRVKQSCSTKIRTERAGLPCFSRRSWTMS